MNKNIQNRKYKIEGQKFNRFCSLFFVLCSNKSASRGYILLFTVLLASLILSIALGITSLAYRETSLNITAKNSQYALFAADSAAECALNHLLRTDSNPFVGWPDGVQISCGGTTLVSDNLNGAGNEPNYIFNEGVTNIIGPTGVSLPRGCGIARIFQPSGSTVLRVQGIGYNVTCPMLFPPNNVTGNRVERAIEYTFLLTGGDGGEGINNPEVGNGLLPVSLFDPSNINMDLLGVNQNNQGGVLGNSQDGSFFTEIFNGVLDLFGIENNNSNNGQQEQVGNYNGNLDGMINNNSGNNGDGNMLSSDGDGNLYVNDNGNIRDLVSGSGLDVNTTKTGELGNGAGQELQAQDSSPFGDLLKEVNTDKTDVLQKNIEDTLFEINKNQGDLKVLNENTKVSITQENISAAENILDSYAQKTGQRDVVESINTKTLVSIANTSFPGVPLNSPEVVSSLLDLYSAKTGNLEVAKQIDPQVFYESIIDYQNKVQETREQPVAEELSLFEKTVSFFKDIVGIEQNQKSQLLRKNTPERVVVSDAISLVANDYADKLGIPVDLDMQKITESLNTTLPKGEITPIIAEAFLSKYNEKFGESKFLNSMDSKTLAEFINTTREESTVMSETTQKEPSVFRQMLDSVVSLFR